MADSVRYDHTVVDVLPVTDGCRAEDEVPHLDVVSRHAGATRVFRARNVVVAVGLELSLPDGVTAAERVWHNLDLLPRAAAFPVQRPERFIVVGAGQSAAESVAFLHERFPSAEICSVFFRYGYSPADDSPYANRIFDPEAVDLYFDAPADTKRMLFDYHRNTNYSVVDMDLIEELYRRSYREKVLGRARLRMLNASRLTELRSTADGVSATVEFLPSGETKVLDADAIVFATGYRPTDATSLLGVAGLRCQRDAEGMVRVRRDYRVVTDEALTAGIYLQGGTEHAHGITSTLLSNVAVRAGELTRSIAGTARPEPRPAPPPLALTAERG
jgi:L-ornithine N5-oxygenase